MSCFYSVYVDLQYDVPFITGSVCLGGRPWSVM